MKPSFNCGCANTLTFSKPFPANAIEMIPEYLFSEWFSAATPWLNAWKSLIEVPAATQTMKLQCL
jgi:hypothetical protein